jgi:ABC-2 type transport system ATP-binding protein
MSVIIAVDDLVISYDKTLPPAVNHVSLSVSRGESLGLLGGNGAGKTSTLRAIAAVTPATAGYIDIAGHNASTAKGAEIIRARVGYCPDTSGLIRQATVREHVGIALALRDETLSWPDALRLVEAFGLRDVLDRDTAGFSHGMSRRLSVLLAAITATDALILDEPFDGVDPLGVRATQNVIAAAKDNGLAVIVSTHLLPLLTSVSDNIAVMVAGQIVDNGPSYFFEGPSGAERYDRALVGNK